MTAAARNAALATVPVPRTAPLPAVRDTTSLVLALADFTGFEAYLEGLGVSAFALRAPRAVTL